jgi:hypothetical protein
LAGHFGLSFAILCHHVSDPLARRCTAFRFRIVGAPSFLERIPDLARRFAGVGIGCDLIAYTESEYRVLVDRHDRFARAVLDDSIVLACRAQADDEAHRGR